MGKWFGCAIETVRFNKSVANIGKKDQTSVGVKRQTKSSSFPSHGFIHFSQTTIPIFLPLKTRDSNKIRVFDAANACGVGMCVCLYGCGCMRSTHHLEKFANRILCSYENMINYLLKWSAKAKSAQYAPESGSSSSPTIAYIWVWMCVCVMVFWYRNLSIENWFSWFWNALTI